MMMMNDIIKVMLFYLVLVTTLLIFLLRSKYDVGLSILTALILYLLMVSLTIFIMSTAQKNTMYIPKNVEEIKVEDYFTDNEKDIGEETYIIEIKDQDGNLLKTKEVNCTFFEALGVTCDTLRKLETH